MDIFKRLLNLKKGYSRNVKRGTIFKDVIGKVFPLIVTVCHSCLANLLAQKLTVFRSLFLGRRGTPILLGSCEGNVPKIPSSIQ